MPYSLWLIGEKDSIPAQTASTSEWKIFQNLRKSTGGISGLLLLFFCISFYAGLFNHHRSGDKDECWVFLVWIYTYTSLLFAFRLVHEVSFAWIRTDQPVVVRVTVAILVFPKIGRASNAARTVAASSKIDKVVLVMTSTLPIEINKWNRHRKKIGINIVVIPRGMCVRTHLFYCSYNCNQWLNVLASISSFEPCFLCSQIASQIRSNIFPFFNHWETWR